jgi:5-formyltetrahydrofolate cyclo-ligase
MIFSENRYPLFGIMLDPFGVPHSDVEPDRMTDATLTDTKAALRREALAGRDALPADLRQSAAETIASRTFPLDVGSGVRVSGFSPFGSEINPLPLMRRLAERGALLALPVVICRGRPLVFRSWAFGEPLAKGVWGIRQPPPEAAEVDPDILLVPLAAFDRAGHRIGFGAGYYDLTLAGLRARKSVVAIGLAYAAQEIPAVPATTRDARLDLVLTEREIIDFRKA